MWSHKGKWSQARRLAFYIPCSPCESCSVCFEIIGFQETGTVDGWAGWIHGVPHQKDILQNVLLTVATVPVIMVLAVLRTPSTDAANESS